MCPAPFRQERYEKLSEEGIDAFIVAYNKESGKPFPESAREFPPKKMIPGVSVLIPYFLSEYKDCWPYSVFGVGIDNGKDPIFLNAGMRAFKVATEMSGLKIDVEKLYKGLKKDEKRYMEMNGFRKDTDYHDMFV